MKPVAVVTGASGGIGSEMARAFAKEEYHVFCGYRTNRQAALAVVQEIQSFGGSASAVQADVAAPAGAESFAQEILAQCGRVDVLVNNAGIAQQKQLQDISWDDWQTVTNTNLGSVYLVTRSFLPGMIYEKKGRIINVSSVWGVTGSACETHYSAAKAGVIGFTKALAKEVGPSGITVNCIAPGVIDTAMLDDFSKEDLAKLADATPLARIGTPADIAGLAVFLASQQAGFITGQVIQVDGGFCL